MKNLKKVLLNVVCSIALVAALSGTVGATQYFVEADDDEFANCAPHMAAVEKDFPERDSSIVIQWYQQNLPENAMRNYLDKFLGIEQGAPELLRQLAIRTEAYCAYRKDIGVEDVALLLQNKRERAINLLKSIIAKSDNGALVVHAEELIVMMGHSNHVDYALRALQNAFGQRVGQLETKGKFQEALGNARKVALYSAYLSDSLELLRFSASYSGEAMKNSSPPKVDLTIPYGSNIRAVRVLRRGDDPYTVFQTSMEDSIMARRPGVGPTMAAKSAFEPD